MSNLTKITDELLAVVEPVDAEDFYFVMEGNIIYERLGTVSETEIDFDTAEYVENEKLYINGIFQNTLYMDYFIPDDLCEWYIDCNLSFRSLLKSKGITPTPETKIVILKKI